MVHLAYNVESDKILNWSKFLGDHTSRTRRLFVRSEYE